MKRLDPKQSKARHIDSLIMTNGHAFTELERDKENEIIMTISRMINIIQKSRLAIHAVNDEAP